MTEAMLSRVADHLYWMSRYLERAEHSVRLLHVNLDMLIGQQSDQAAERWQQLFTSLTIEMPPDLLLDDYHIMEWLISDSNNPNSIFNCITNARENARHVRELISTEMWEQLNILYLQIKATDLYVVWKEEPFSYLRTVANGLLLFQGVTDSTMNHGEGWHFIQAGRAIERATATAHLLQVHSAELTPRASQHAVEHYLHWVSILKSCTAFEAYVKIYSADVRPEQLTEFLLLNTEFPHTVYFAIGQLENALRSITEQTEHNKNIRVNRLAGRLRAMLGYTAIDEIMETGLPRFLLDVQAQCADVHAAIHATYVTYPIETALS